jgi:hypothetical protein
VDPHDVLGVPPTATRDEIETAYRAALRRSHPDLHQAAGPEEVARAEAETRRLNEAIARLRSGWLSSPTGTGPGSAGPGPATSAATPPRRSEDRFGFRTGPDTDWFGNPLDRRIRADRVECPFCRLPFGDPVVYRSHLAHDHGYGDPVVTPRRTRVDARAWTDRLAWMGWIPAAWLWLLVPLAAYWALLAVALGDSVTARVLVWVGVAGYAAGLALNHHFGRRSP